MKISHLILFTFLLFGTAIALTGKIEDVEGKSLSDVKITLLKLDSSFTVDSSGEFQIFEEVEIAPKDMRYSTISISLHPEMSRMIVQCPVQGMGKLSLYTLSGKRVFHEKRHFIYGSNSFIIPTLGKGLYLGEISQGGTTSSFKLLNSLQGVPQTISRIQNQRTASQESIIDTVEIAKAGYETVHIPIVSYSANLGVIQLRAPAVSGRQRRVISTGESFTMGNCHGEQDEQNEHQVTFPYSLNMDTTEVTFSEFHRVMSSYYHDYRPIESWRNGYDNNDSIPVYDITWYDAALYCNAKSRMLGLDTIYVYDGRRYNNNYNCDTLFDIRTYEINTYYEFNNIGRYTTLQFDTTFLRDTLPTIPTSHTYYVERRYRTYKYSHYLETYIIPNSTISDSISSSSIYFVRDTTDSIKYDTLQDASFTVDTIFAVTGDTLFAISDNIIDTLKIINTRDTLRSRRAIFNNLGKSGYRLPMESEWEFVIKKHNTGTLFYWGDKPNSTLDGKPYAWFNMNTKTVQKVATTVPTNDSIYDLSGNVWEWCNDWYISDYPTENKNALEHVSLINENARTAHKKTYRGGAWKYDWKSLLCTSRHFNYPDHHYDYLGFRCVKVVR